MCTYERTISDSISCRFEIYKQLPTAITVIIDEQDNRPLFNILCYMFHAHLAIRRPNRLSLDRNAQLHRDSKNTDQI
ncbi:unnamed protein product [Adineta ricciae]|uniref:Uncharacterized protein n=1 Tax=Adineta ricciae TaxID=249248 RepID=A0A814KBD6_ADIRI|nr:unnamed protein product [Adineta ricciae]